MYFFFKILSISGIFLSLCSVDKILSKVDRALLGSSSVKNGT